MEKSYRYISYFFAAFLLFVLAAFFKTYFGLFPHFGKATYVTHYHALTILLWLGMLIVQPILIRKKQVEWHRLVGKASYILFPMLVLGYLLVINQSQLKEKHLDVFAANMLDVPLFIVFYSLAMYYRHKTAYHVRFIILTIIPFIGPASARIPIDSLSIILVFLASLLIFEYFTNKTYKPYLIGIGIFTVNLAIVAYLFLGNQPLLQKIWGLFWG